MKLTMIAISALVLAGFSGCASLSNSNRDAQRELIDSCKPMDRGLYFASTKEDLSYVITPFLPRETCKKYGTNCYGHFDIQTIAAIASLADIPFGVIRDVYEIPTDHAYNKKRNECVGVVK